MKKHVFLAVCLMAFGCKTATSDDPVKTYSVKYEVITGDQGKWFGEYINEVNTKVCLCTADQLKSNGWVYQFSITKKPFVLHIDATTEKNFGNPGAADVTSNIYVDGKLVASNTNKWAPGVTSADYTIQ